MEVLIVILLIRDKLLVLLNKRLAVALPFLIDSNIYYFISPLKKAGLKLGILFPSILDIVDLDVSPANNAFILAISTTQGSL